MAVSLLKRLIIFWYTVHMTVSLMHLNPREGCNKRIRNAKPKHHTNAINMIMIGLVRPRMETILGFFSDILHFLRSRCKVLCSILTFLLRQLERVCIRFWHRSPFYGFSTWLRNIGGIKELKVMQDVSFQITGVVGKLCIRNFGF